MPFCFRPSVRVVFSHIRAIRVERIKLICALKLAYLRLGAIFATVRNLSLFSLMVAAVDP